MARARKLGASALVAIMTATGLALISPASPADAATCVRAVQGRQGFTICYDGPAYRVRVECEDNNGDPYNSYGPWVTPSSISAAWCAEGSFVRNVYTEH